VAQIKPDKNSRESPGKKKPIINPFSAKMMTSNSANPP
jgi:hypothetical protein